ncbi:ATP-binding protein [Streptosporangium sp. NPDC049304]|uniref:ATP-binding protein n=1 Tax=Streptosporangium sp. NPDC049304 TaxID=3154830 RepID=UPI0034136963
MNERAPQPRQSGRHRRGAVTERVDSRPWDLAERAAAEQLDQIEPAWTVWYGTGTRHFHAVAVWPAAEPLIVRARTADELRALMREAEDTTPPPRGGSMPETPDTPPEPDDSRTPDDPRTVCWDLPHDLPIVGKARAMASETLAAWGLHHLVDDVALVVGELLADHQGEPVVRLSLWADADEFQVQVTDRGPGQPRHLTLDPESLHGRGLAIVRALAHDHGVNPLPDRPGKTVWARWHLPPRVVRPAF